MYSEDVIAPVLGGLGELVGLANDGVSEHDLDLRVRGLAGDRFEPGLLRRLSDRAAHERLEAAHEHEQPEDAEGPEHEHCQQEELIRRHVNQCLTP